MPYYTSDLQYFEEEAGVFDLTCDECGEWVGDTRDPENYIGGRLPDPLLCDSCEREED